MSPSELTAYAVVLAGGRGTRFWPRSRTRRPKQLLNIVGYETMLQQTVARLRPAFAASHIWIVTNEEQAPAVRRQAHSIPASQVLVEPCGRNTAAAIGLAAVHLRKVSAASGGDALMAVLPSDHFIGRRAKYVRILRAALRLAAVPGRLVVLGIPPTRPETGFGYVEREGKAILVGGCSAYAVRRFTEKPNLPEARRYVGSARYSWNAGMFFWRVSTFLDNLKRFLPDSYWSLERLADGIGTDRYTRMLRTVYPRLENISVDYAILESAARQKGKPAVFVFPAELGWSDIGSWAAVYELLARKRGENVSAGEFLALDSQGNFLWSPEKFVAAIGVNDLVIVETRDALLVCPRDRAQDAGKAVQWLEKHHKQELL